MTKKHKRRLAAKTLAADRRAYTALQEMADYNPSNPTYNQEAVTGAHTGMDAAQTAEVNAENALDAARDTAVEAEWAFHDAILGVKQQVIAQYGDDSDQVQALGLKKKSEHRR